MKLLNNKCIAPIIIVIAVGLVNCLYFAIIYALKIVGKDPLNIKYFHLVGNCCSGWAIGHFVLYFIIGLLYPDCGILAIGFGALWELIEVIIGSFQEKNKNPNPNVQYANKWWAGNMIDIFINAAGFYTGALLHKLCKKKETYQDFVRKECDDCDKCRCGNWENCTCKKKKIEI